MIYLLSLGGAVLVGLINAFVCHWLACRPIDWDNEGEW